MKKIIIKSKYEKPIKMGDEGQIVKDVSILLALHGSSIKPVDKFMIGMRSAVVAFQKKNKLPATAKIDKKTWEKLVKHPQVQVKA